MRTWLPNLDPEIKKSSQYGIGVGRDQRLYEGKRVHPITTNLNQPTFNKDVLQHYEEGVGEAISRPHHLQHLHVVKAVLGGERRSPLQSKKKFY